jgi:hypothetical protein
MSVVHVKDILQSSRRNNPALGITGVLVHGGGQFMQILEGPEREVLRLYVKIMEDSRNANCQIIHISPANDRMFKEWSMGVIESDPLKFQHIMELRSRRLEAVRAREFTAVMTEFLRRLTTAADS